MFCKGDQVSKHPNIYEGSPLYMALPDSKHGWPEGHHQGHSWGDGQRGCVLNEALGCQERGGWKKCLIVKNMMI